MTLLNSDFTELWLYFTVTLLNCDFTELWLYWTVTLLYCDFTELWLYWTVTLLYCDFTDLWLYFTVTLLNCDFTLLTLLNCYFTLLNCNFTEMSFVYRKFLNLNFLWLYIYTSPMDGMGQKTLMFFCCLFRKQIQGPQPPSACRVTTFRDSFPFFVGLTETGGGIAILFQLM